MEQGVFYGVSVGPGDAELLTVKAFPCQENTARELRYALAENCGLPGERLSLSEIPEHAGYFTTVIVRR